MVVGHLLGLSVRGVDTHPDGVGGFGHTTFEPPRPAEPAPGMAGAAPPPAGPARDERVLVTFLAGLAAETRQAGRDMTESAAFDLDALVREWLPAPRPGGEAVPQALARLRAQAEALVGRPEAWRAIEVVAAALLARGELEGAEAVRLIEGAMAPPGAAAGSEP